MCGSSTLYSMWIKWMLVCAIHVTTKFPVRAWKMLPMATIFQQQASSRRFKVELFAYSELLYCTTLCMCPSLRMIDHHIGCWKSWKTFFAASGTISISRGLNQILHEAIEELIDVVITISVELTHYLVIRSYAWAI